LVSFRKSSRIDLAATAPIFPEKARGKYTTICVVKATIETQILTMGYGIFLFLGRKYHGF
jgi:hypothetical protein